MSLIPSFYTIHTYPKPYLAFSNSKSNSTSLCNIHSKKRLLRSKTSKVSKGSYRIVGLQKREDNLRCVAIQPSTNFTCDGDAKTNNTNNQRKPRFLCLHGFRASGEIFKKQIFNKWPAQVVDKLDLVFVDAPFPSQGKSQVEGIFDPPYYEWFQFVNKELSEYQNFEKCLTYIEECMIKHGPFDGLLGFSQGAGISGVVPGLQEKGVTLTKMPKIKYLIIIGGSIANNESLAEKAYSSPITCPSVHFLGERDYLKKSGKKLLESCVDPVVIHHPKGHTIPELDEKGLEIMLSFIEKMQAEISK